jgi:hypothetical protein
MFTFSPTFLPPGFSIIQSWSQLKTGMSDRFKSLESIKSCIEIERSLFHAHLQLYFNRRMFIFLDRAFRFLYALKWTKLQVQIITLLHPPLTFRVPHVKFSTPMPNHNNNIPTKELVLFLSKVVHFCMVHINMSLTRTVSSYQYH